MTTNVRVWVTRAQPGADATAARLRALGFAPILAPLLEVRPIPGGDIDLAGVAALAFTSANGVAAFAARARRRDLPVFAVGAATAEAARAHGFGDVISAQGDVEALARLIRDHGDLAGEVLCPGPTEPAADLAAALAARGVRARRLVVYETIEIRPARELDKMLRDTDAVLLHSPKAARAFAAWAADHPTSGLAIFCLSDNIAAPLAGLPLPKLEVARAPNEDALLDLLVR